MKARKLIISTVLLTILTILGGGAAVQSQEAEKLKPVKKSADERFWDVGDGTILDTQSRLMWMKKDYWQLQSQWVNWYTAIEFVQRMNNKKYAGHTDWRLPTPEEAGGLYERRKRNMDKDGDKIFMDRIFPQGPGWATWTSEDKGKMAVVVSFKDRGGKDYQDKLSGSDAFIRLVRGPVS